MEYNICAARAGVEHVTLRSACAPVYCWLQCLWSICNIHVLLARALPNPHRNFNPILCACFEFKAIIRQRYLNPAFAHISLFFLRGPWVQACAITVVG